MSKLEQHCESELRRAGLFDKTSDYDGAIGPAVMKLVRAFVGDGHSGGSAHMVLSAFDRVIRWKTLTPITSDPAEWMDVAELVPESPGATWQNKRNPSIFSTDGGKTHYDIDADNNREIKESEQP